MAGGPPQLTVEVAAAGRGALDAGASEIWVKDSHDSGQNILAAGWPQEVRLVRGRSGHPLKTPHGPNETLAAVLLIGHQAGAASGWPPLRPPSHLEP